jgi:hypothetical protein
MVAAGVLSPALVVGMITPGQLIRVMNVSKTDQVLVGTALERIDAYVSHQEGIHHLACDIPMVKIRPLFGDDVWVAESDCDVLTPSDL